MAKKLVYVVDDDSDLAGLVAGHIAELQDVEVKVYNNGASLLSQAEVARPDLVVTDLRMPRVDGFRVVGVLRTMFPREGLPVVVMSGTGDEADVRQLLAAGADDYLVKPADRDVIKDRVTRLLRRGLPPSDPRILALDLLPHLRQEESREGGGILTSLYRVFVVQKWGRKFIITVPRGAETAPRSAAGDIVPSLHTMQVFEQGVGGHKLLWPAKSEPREARGALPRVVVNVA